MPDSSPLPTVKIEQAIDALLRALIERPAPPQRAEHVVTATDIEDGDVDEGALDAVIAEPVGSACHREIASLGDFLFDVVDGSMDEVATIADRIAAMDAVGEARRSAILHECWGEVGMEDDEA